MAGALIIDSAGVVATPVDRVFVLQAASDSLESPELGSLSPPVVAINGRSGPHTEGLSSLESNG